MPDARNLGNGLVPVEIPFGPMLDPHAWGEPENDPTVLRYELDGCRAEIARLRAELKAELTATHNRIAGRPPCTPPEGYTMRQWCTVCARLEELE